MPEPRTTVFKQTNKEQINTQISNTILLENDALKIVSPHGGLREHLDHMIILQNPQERKNHGSPQGYTKRI
jgi:hypothetical protein